MPADTSADVSAWRLALHAQYMARITARPEMREPEVMRTSGSPVRLHIDVDPGDPFEVLADGATLTLEPLFPHAGPRSFDWEDSDHRRLRRAS